MNEIGSKDTTNKENVASLVVDELADGPPQWMQSAFVHLTSRDLGPDWRTCVDTWVRLEENLEYGVRGKVRSPPISMYTSNMCMVGCTTLNQAAAV
jgi:hypothetical protein